MKVSKSEVKVVEKYLRKQKKVQPGLEMRLSSVKYILRKINGDVRSRVRVQF